MNLDFPAFLVAATFLTGIIWLIDALFFASKRQQGNLDSENPAVREPLLVEYSKSFFPIILAVLVLRSFIVEPFRIPSGSMMPTLLVGDFILVNKFSYGIKLPVINKKIIEIGEPERGDVVVFKYPQ
ncbi:MAG: signal peptidase I, partial [Candidatus Sedimenticola sp. 6PFRAG7]